MPNETQPAPVETSDPGDDLLAAFLGEEAAGVEDSKQFERPAEADADEPEEAEAGAEDEEADAEAAAEGDEEAEDEAAETSEPDGDFVEHEGKKIAVGDLLEAYTFKQSHEKNLTELRSKVIEDAGKEAEAIKGTWTKRAEAIEQAYEFLQTLVPQYERPSASMLDRNSPDYDPDNYHFLNHQINQIEARKAEAAQKVREARSQRDEEAKEKHQKLVKDNAAKLAAKFPDFKGEKVAELATALKKHYGFDDETLSSVVDHRFFELAMDAAAYRASREKGAPKPKEAKAPPKLVRSTAKVAPKGVSKRKTEAEKILKKTGKIVDREAIFGAFLD